MKKKEFPNIDPVFEGSFPEGYRPWVPSWSVSKEELDERLEDGTPTLSQLDISIPNPDFVEAVDAGESLQEINKIYRLRYQELACGIGCKNCFDCRTKIQRHLMTTDEVLSMIEEAKELGVKTMKFLGPGELLHNPDLFKILDFIKEQDIKFGIFTKGVALGDDTIPMEKFGMTAKEMCKKLAEYDNVSILLSLTSADRETDMARNTPRNKKFANIFDIRNKAFENLAEIGLNSDPNNQRLALICAPVLNDNIDEVLEIYEWALERNIPTVVAPTMCSGKGKEMPEIKDEQFKQVDLVKLYVDIYTMMIRKKILTVAQIEEEGVSPYAGYACNQFIGGMFVRSDGRIQGCPGNEAFSYGSDVRKEGLKEVWKKSTGHKLREEMAREGTTKLTQPCYAKTENLIQIDGAPVVKKGEGSITEGFYEKVMKGIKERVGEII